MGGEFRERGDRPEEPQVVKENPVPPKPSTPSPINWWTLNPVERAEAFGVLLIFVPELVRRYGLTDKVVPPCWFQHEAMIQELLALFQYRNQQQYTQKAPPSAAIDFHYYFSLWQARMRAWGEATGCTSTTHRDTAISPWVDETKSEHAEWQVDAEEFVSAFTGRTLIPGTNKEGRPVYVVDSKRKDSDR